MIYREDADTLAAASFLAGVMALFVGVLVGEAVKALLGRGWAVAFLLLFVNVQMIAWARVVRQEIDSRERTSATAAVERGER